MATYTGGENRYTVEVIGKGYNPQTVKVRILSNNGPGSIPEGAEVVVPKRSVTK